MEVLGFPPFSEQCKTFEFCISQVPMPLLPAVYIYARLNALHGSARLRRICNCGWCVRLRLLNSLPRLPKCLTRLLHLLSKCIDLLRLISLLSSIHLHLLRIHRLPIAC